jgi:hypothetical protein
MGVTSQNTGLKLHRCGEKNQVSLMKFTNVDVDGETVMFTLYEYFCCRQHESEQIKDCTLK